MLFVVNCKGISLPPPPHILTQVLREFRGPFGTGWSGRKKEPLPSNPGAFIPLVTIRDGTSLGSRVMRKGK